MGQGLAQGGAGPVDQGHEVVADRVDAVGRKIGHALTVIGKKRRKISVATFDAFVDRQAFHHDPLETRGLDFGLAGGDQIAGPDLAIGDFMQGGDNALCPGLGNFGQGDLVEGAIPTPAFDHVRASIAPFAPLLIRDE